MQGVALVGIGGRPKGDTVVSPSDFQSVRYLTCFPPKSYKDFSSPARVHAHDAGTYAHGSE